MVFQATQVGNFSALGTLKTVTTIHLSIAIVAPSCHMLCVKPSQHIIFDYDIDFYES